MEIAILAMCLFILSTANIIQLIRNGQLNKKLTKLSNDFNNLNTKFEESKNKREIDELASLIGSRATMNQSLCYDNKDNFNVIYEVEILDISKSISSIRAKIKVLDYSSTDSIANEPSKRSGIISFMNNKWVNKKELSIIIDESTKRDAKLRTLGID